MKKIEFVNLQEALIYAEYYGGWIFHGDNFTIWYNAEFYNMSKIIKDAPESGKVGTRSYFKSSRRL